MNTDLYSTFEKKVSYILFLKENMMPLQTCTVWLKICKIKEMVDVLALKK